MDDCSRWWCTAERAEALIAGSVKEQRRHDAAQRKVARCHCRRIYERRGARRGAQPPLRRCADRAATWRVRRTVLDSAVVLHRTVLYCTTERHIWFGHSPSRPLLLEWCGPTSVMDSIPSQACGPRCVCATLGNPSLSWINDVGHASYIARRMRRRRQAPRGGW